MRSYTRSLADYFVRASEPHAPFGGIIGGLSTIQEAEFQHLVQQLRLRDGSPSPSTSVLISHSSSDRTSLMTLCFPNEIDDHGAFAEISDIVDGVVPHDEYIDEMLAMSLSPIEERFHPGLTSPFDLFGVSFIEIIEETQTAPAPEIVEDAIAVVDLIDGPAGLVEGVSDFVDSPLSFNVLSGFVSRPDYVSDFSSMDLSIFEYLHVSYDIDLFAPSSPTSQIFDIDDEMAQHDSDDDSSSVSDSDPVDQRVSPAIGDIEIVDFGTADQPRELRIGSDLSVDERDILIQLLGAYLDVFAWSYEDMPGLDPSIIQHRLPLLLHAKPVKQKLRRLHPRWSLQVKEAIQKQLSVGFLSMVEYPSGWPMSSMFPKRTARSFDVVLYGRIFRYSQVLMAPEDMEKTSSLPSGFRLRLNPKKCTFGVTSGKLLGYMVSERSIEVDPDKIRAILDMPAPRIEREVRGFLGRLQYISRFIARLTDILPAHIREDPRVLAVTPILAPPTPGRPLLLYLSVSDVALGCMLAQLDDSPALVGRLMRWLVLLTEFDIHYVTQKSIRGSIVTDHLASLPVSDGRAIDDDFPDEDVVAATSLTGWSMYFDGAANHSGYGIGVLLISPHGDHIPRSVRLAFSDRHPATNNIVEYEDCILGLETALELGIRQMEVFGDSNLVLRQIQGEWKTRDVKLRPYHAYLELLVGRFDDLRYTHMSRAQNQFADALATLASMIDIPVDATVRPLLIESRYALAYCCLIEDTEIDDGLPWYHNIYHFLRLGVYHEAATAKDKRALRQLAARFVICGETLYRRSADGMLLLCLDRASADRVMREFHAGVCEPHMGGHMLARKIMRTGYFWLTMETDCCHFVQRCLECQIHGDLIHVPPSELHALTSPWPFSVWGIDIIGKISPKSSSGHEFILVAIDYFTKWVEAASYARLTSSGVASFIKSHIIYRYGVPHEPQTDGAVEAANKNIKRILRRMIETSRDWSEKLPFALWVYRTSFRTSIGATPYSLIPEADWAQARFDQLNLLDERRLRAADHVCAYQRKMAHAFKKRVRPRPLRIDDLVLKVIRGLIKDPRGKFKPNWSGPYFIRELTPEGAAWLMDLDGNRFLEPTNVDQLKRTDSIVFGLPGSPEIHPASSALLDAWMPSCLSIWEVILDIWHISVSIEIYESSWSCMLIPTYEIHIDTMFPPWSLSGVTQLGLHFATLRCHHAFLSGDAPLIYGSDSIVHVDDLDRAFDDG
ncbi:Ribonuclease HI [Vitis vinifera]|uniref:Ribonuclease HI n=1 Tax=Vitis vinifera TaxID=29760 RepID=A0A438GPV2_VITVI|nr:Ribonuclease HI [Vitis vinifera]